MIPILRDNSMIVTGLLAWFLAQLIKFFIDLAKHRKINLRRFFDSGGMPSSHSAFVCSIALVTGYRHGFASDFFALAFMMAVIVMYDAMGVRRAAGEQAEAINELREKMSGDQMETELDFPEWQKPLREALGHKPIEVLSGAILGIAVAALAII